MSTVIKALWSLTMAFLVTGCSSYTLVYELHSGNDVGHANNRNHEIEVGHVNNRYHEIEPGDNVRITLTDDTSVKGRVTEFSENKLTVETTKVVENNVSTSFEMPEELDRKEEIERIGIAFSNIKAIERHRGPAAGLVVFGVLGGFIGFIVLAAVASGEGFWTQ